MILHFVKRDFDSSKHVWIIAAVFTVVLLLAGAYGDVAANSGFLLMGAMLMIFGHAVVLGTNLRSQHVMSRTYLLSLPISRTRLFRINFLRAWVFALPLCGAAFGTVFSLLASKNAPLYFYPLAGALCVAGIGLAISLLTSSQLRSEQILGMRDSAHKRFFAWCAMFIVMYLQLALPLITLLYFSAQPSLLSLVASLAAVGVFGFYTDRRAQSLWLNR